MKSSLLIPLQAYLTIPSLDPDDARRRKLLNILLTGIAALSIIGFATIALLDVSDIHIGGDQDIQEAQLFLLLYITAITLFIGSILIYLINRFVSGEIASALFLVFLTLVFLFSDEPLELINGRSLFFFSIPIFMASVLIRSVASYVAAGGIITVLSIMAMNFGVTPNLMAHLGFLLVATIAWLSARTLEQTLVDLRTTNRDLDHRVKERTQQLSDALVRERSEASKNLAILEGIADGVILFDNEGKAAVTNPAIVRLFKIPDDAIIGLDSQALAEWIVKSPHERTVFLEMINYPDRNNENIRFEWNDRTISMNASPVLTSQGARIGTAAVFRDFTHEAEMDKMKDSFLAMVSHELRTPLNAILGYTEMLQEGIYGDISSEQREATVRVWTNSRRLLDLVSDLLDQAQIESGMISFQNKPFAPGELVSLMHSVMDQIANEKGLKLTSCIEQSMPAEVNGDLRRLQQIMVNLVNNAVKYTDRGEVRVRLYMNSGSHWYMEVSDTGRGIPQDLFPVIFEPFRQGKNVSREHKGIGLGLSIVKRLVDIMGGQIDLNSTLGKGTVFTVTVPETPNEKGNDNGKETISNYHRR
jgi:signal transduction histidine kinase